MFSIRRRIVETVEAASHSVEQSSNEARVEEETGESLAPSISEEAAAEAANFANSEPSSNNGDIADNTASENPAPSISGASSETTYVVDPEPRYENPNEASSVRAACLMLQLCPLSQ
jgi:hypothetical protein